MPQPVGPITHEALTLERQRIEHIAHNLANLHTPAFRATNVAASSVEFNAAVRRSSVPQATTYPASPGGASSTGALRATGRALDIALAGEGHLEVATPAGPAYTRRGDLQVEADGRLVNHLGHPVLGWDGEIVLVGHSPRIDSTGRIREGVGSSEREVAKLRILAIEPGNLRSAGSGLFSAAGPVREVQPGSVDVRQGFLEASSVDVASEMLGLSRSLRHFETVLRAIQARGEITGSAIRVLGSGQ